jgi:hypothetical protein
MSTMFDRCRATFDASPPITVGVGALRYGTGCLHADRWADPV